MRKITLNEALKIMEEINKSDDWVCFFENGRMVIYSNFYILNNGKQEKKD